MAKASMAAASAGDEKAIVGYFEVHVRRDDRWMIDCTSRLADDALAEATEIVKRNEVRAVKVVHERYNPSTDQSASRVIYDFAKPERRRGQTVLRLAQPRPLSAAPAMAETAAAMPNHLPAVGTRAHRPPVRHRSPPPPAPWTAFAIATLALAITATLLVIILAVSG